MKLLIKLYDKFEEYLLVGSLVFTVILVFIQVIMRYILNSSLSWSEELARYIFVWQSWLGASLGVKHSKHIRVELIYSFVKGRGRHVVGILSLLLWFGLCVFLLVNGASLVQNLVQRNAASPAMQIPLYYVYASVPVGCGIMGLRIIQQIYEEVVVLFNLKGGKA